MIYLGYTNPFYHLGGIMRGYLAAPYSILALPRRRGREDADAQTSWKRYGLRISRRPLYV
jgi:hypothetical protein